MVADALLTSKNPHYNTPQALLAPIGRFAGEAGIALDPCSNAGSIVQARRALRGDSPFTDGLRVPWRGNGLVYVNPPYGRPMAAWCAKAREEAEAGAEIIMLVPARTDTAWWHDTAPFTDAFAFLRGRLTFAGEKHPAPFPNALLYWGKRKEAFAHAFDDIAWIVLL